MIGYSQNAKTRYHKIDPNWMRRGSPYRAACDLVRRLHHVFISNIGGNMEARLKDHSALAAYLSRCPRCWEGEK